MPLRECIESHTQRELDLWMMWLGEQWDQPSLTDHYIMQLTAEVRRWKVKDHRTVKMEDFKLKTKEDAPKTASVSTNQLAIAKSRWFGITGYKGQR